VDYDLQTILVDSLPFYVSGYTTGLREDFWISRGIQWVEARRLDGTVTRRVILPKTQYRHIQVEGENFVVFDTQANQIHLWGPK
jgi:hypothetical protein